MKKRNRRDYQAAWRAAHPDYALTWRRENAERRAASTAAWRAANPEKVQQMRRDWDAANRDKRRDRNYRRRAALQAAAAEEVLATVVYDRDGWMCGICGESIDRQLAWPDPMSVSLDHRRPLEAGGPHTYDNVQAAHLRCNIRKGSKIA